MRVQSCSENHEEDVIVVTPEKVWRAARGAWTRFWLWVQEALACRQCGRPARPWDRVCQHCGTGNPVKIGVSPQLMLTAVACEMVLLYLNLRLS